MAEHKPTPQIRFAGFSDDWEPLDLGSITKSYSGGTPLVSNNGYYGGNIPFIRSGEINSDSTEIYITEEGLNKSSAKMVNRGNILYALYGATSGEVGISKIKGAINQAILAFLPVEGYDAEFITQWLSINKKNIVNTYLQGGQGNLSANIVKSLNIDFPDSEEQEKIGAFFKDLDTLIDLHQRKYDKLIQLKKAMLEKMFPKNGSKAPEIRFAGFSDDWEERELKDMTNYKNGKGHEDKQSNRGRLELINLNSISIDGGLKPSGKYIDKADETLKKNDLVMVLSDVGHGDLLGRVAIIPEDEKFVLNQRVALLRPNETINPQFLYTCINARQLYFKCQGAGSSQLNISKESVEKFNPCIPRIEEQQKIGNYFKDLDTLIDLHQRKHNKLIQIKKAMLEKMFV